jgi:hypothetical protein
MQRSCQRRDEPVTVEEKQLWLMLFQRKKIESALASTIGSIGFRVVRQTRCGSHVTPAVLPFFRCRRHELTAKHSPAKKFSLLRIKSRLGYLD